MKTKTWCLSCRFMRYAGECEHVLGLVVRPSVDTFPSYADVVAERAKNLKRMAREDERAGALALGYRGVGVPLVRDELGWVPATTPQPVVPKLYREGFEVPVSFVGRTFKCLRGARNVLRILLYREDPDGIRWFHTDNGAGGQKGIFEFDRWMPQYLAGDWEELVRNEAKKPPLSDGVAPVLNLDNPMSVVGQRFSIFNRPGAWTFVAYHEKMGNFDTLSDSGEHGLYRLRAWQDDVMSGRWKQIR